MVGVTNTKKGRQSWIIDRLKSDPAKTYKQVFKEFESVFAKSEKTFSSDWKQAKKEFQAWQSKISNEVAKQEIKQEVKARQKGVLSKQQTLQILSSIARGEGQKIGKETVYPTFREVISAISQLSKIEGWDAPTKTQQTGSIGIETWVNSPPSLTIEVIDSRDKVLNEQPSS